MLVDGEGGERSTIVNLQKLFIEKKKLKTMGEDEVIGNIGLGYLQDGVSPVQMAGYYQSFANGGF